jgi:hypothetical protein
MTYHKIMQYLAPYWFKIFIIGIALGALIAHIQKLKNNF